MTMWTELTGVPFSVAFVDAGGLATRSLQSGGGEPVVMLHGTSGHLEAFVRNIPALSGRYSCHAIDMMGHGFSEAPDGPYTIPKYVDHVLSYLDACGIDRAHFIGESLGGWVAARLASDHPDKVQSLILVAPGGTVADPKVMDRIKMSTKRAVTTDDVRLTRQRLELLMHDPRVVSDELVDIRHEIYHREQFVSRIDSLLALQELANRLPDLLTEEQLGAIRCPTLVVWGAENPFGDVPEGRKLADSIPDATLVVYEECGHWPQFEQSERFNKDACAFFGSVRT